MKKNLTAMLILNALAFIFTILISIFGIGGVNGYFTVMSLDLCVTIVLLIRCLAGSEK